MFPLVSFYLGGSFFVLSYFLPLLAREKWQIIPFAFSCCGILYMMFPDLEGVDHAWELAVSMIFPAALTPLIRLAGINLQRRKNLSPVMIIVIEVVATISLANIILIPYWRTIL